MTIQVIDLDTPTFVTNWWVNTNEPGIAGIANWHECWHDFKHYDYDLYDVVVCSCGRVENGAIARQELGYE